LIFEGWLLLSILFAAQKKRKTILF
jgi:hypothetical protein